MNMFQKIEGGVKYKRKCIHCGRDVFTTHAGRWVCDRCGYNQRNRDPLRDQAGVIKRV